MRGRVRDWPAVGRWLLIAGAVSYSSWILALFVHTGLSQRAAYTSELEADGQPYAWLFRGCDVGAGMLLLLGGLAALGWAIHARQRARLLLCLACIAVAITGLTNAAAAPLPLDCTSSNGGCLRARARGKAVSGPDRAHHLISNVSGYAFTITMVLLVIVVLLGEGDPLLRRTVIPLAVVGLVTSIPISQALWSAAWRGVPQRISETVEALTFVVLGLAAGARHPVSSQPSRAGP